MGAEEAGRQGILDAVMERQQREGRLPDDGFMEERWKGRTEGFGMEAGDE